MSLTMAGSGSGAAPLAGRTILSIRPEGQGHVLGEAVRAAGGRVLQFATIRIVPVDDPQAAMRALAAPERYDGAIFVSVNAVRAAFGLLAVAWPAAVPALAVGPTTAAALREHGVANVMLPATRFDSEGLLELPLLAAPAGRRLLLVRGEGGRELLREALQARGATVDVVAVYRRERPEAPDPEVAQALSVGGIDAIVAASAESLANLLTCLDVHLRDRLRPLPVFVPHPRVAAAARDAGLTNVHEAAIGDDAMVKAVQQFFARVQR